MPGLEFVDDDNKLDLILLSGKLEGRDNKIIFGSNSGFKKKMHLSLNQEDLVIKVLDTIILLQILMKMVIMI